MTPDDMEAVVSEWLALVRDDEVAGYDPVSEVQVAAISALLLAYQERGRALEPFARFIDVLETMGGNTPRTGTYASLTTATKGDAELTIEHFQQARATLKGKSHD
jgi:hypothetical protein